MARTGREVRTEIILRVVLPRPRKDVLVFLPELSSLRRLNLRNRLGTPRIPGLHRP